MKIVFTKDIEKWNENEMKWVFTNDSEQILHTLQDTLLLQKQNF